MAERGYVTDAAARFGSGAPPPGGGHKHRGMGSEPLHNGERGVLTTLTGEQRLAAPGKRLVHARSSRLSTPSKSKRGHGVVGNTWAWKAPAVDLGRFAVSCSLFATGFTKAAFIVMSLQQDGCRRESTPLRGSEAPCEGFDLDITLYFFYKSR